LPRRPSPSPPLARASPRASSSRVCWSLS
jgi:hypothetical protein